MTKLSVILPDNGQKNLFYGLEKKEILKKLGNYIKKDDINAMYLKDIFREKAEELNIPEDTYHICVDIFHDIDGEELSQYLILPEDTNLNSEKIEIIFDEETFLNEVNKYNEIEADEIEK